MSLAKLLEKEFRGDVRFRGAAYLEAERVSVIRVTPEQLLATVRDGVDFETQLSREDGQLRMFCSCSTEREKKLGHCKHLWATLLAVDEGEYLSGSPRPGHVPPFMTEEPEPLDEIDWEDDLDDDDGDVYVPSRSTSAVAVRTAPQVKPWEAELQKVRRHFVEEHAGSAQQRERQIFFEIDAEQSREAGQLVVQTSQRQRRTNGQWGKLKPLKIKPGTLDDIEHADDRRILAYLGGSTAERTSWYAQQAEAQTAVHRYRVPYELSELILPVMCHTGRVRMMGDHGEDSALSWDEGAPWNLCLSFEFDDDQSVWQLVGTLRRDDEIVRLTDARLIVPGGLVVLDQQVARLNDFEAFDWVTLTTGAKRVTVPDGDESAFVDELLDMPTLPQLELPESLKLEEVRITPRPILLIRSPKTRGWGRDRLKGSLKLDYDGTQVRASSTQWAIVQRSEGRCIVRDRDFETRAWQRLEELGVRRLVDHRRDEDDFEVPAGALARLARTLMEEGWEVRADGQEVRQASNIQFKVTSGIDWFELSANAEFGEANVGFPELLAALSRGDNTVRLDNGAIGILPEEWLKQYGLLTGLGSPTEDHVRFSTTQVGLLDALLSAQESVEVDDRFVEVRDRLADFAGVEPSQEPKPFKGTLRTYQREGLGWLKFLQEFHFGGCLADDMGLGKTVQVLALLLDRKRNRKKSEPVKPSLVVVPKSLLFNWMQETRRFTPQLNVLEYTGLDRAELRGQLPNQDLALTTYGTLRRDILELKEIDFDYVILDEAQAIKNSSSQIAKATRLLQAENRIALSGTPIENHLGDLWSIFEFLNPGMLGRSSAFKLTSADAEDRAARDVLARGLRPFVLRRTKQQVATELPAKFEETIYCEMDADQRRLYDEMRSHYRDSLLGLIEEQGLGKSKMHVLEALLRLRQAACHPGLLDKARSDESSAKLDVLHPHLTELIDEGHKSLVFSQFTSLLSIVREQLDERGIKYAYLDGKTRGRKKVVDQFQEDPDTGVFLISLKAGGLGLNLTAAEYVFLLDPWWNPAVEAQAIDRAHRVGQTKQVFAYRLVCRDTVEEKILELQKSKRELADAILEAEGSVIKDLTADDLELLLS